MTFLTISIDQKISVKSAGGENDQISTKSLYTIDLF